MTDTTSLGLILLAAGSSSRMQGTDKIWVDVNGKPLISYSLDRLGLLADMIVLVVKASDLSRAEEIASDRGSIMAVIGGDHRQQSVAQGLAALPTALEVVAVHDVARPFATSEMLEKGLEVLAGADGAIPALKATDTLKRVDASGWVEGNVDRNSLAAVQTPQVFKSDVLRLAHHEATSVLATDDAALVEQIGRTVRTFEGSPMNIKITNEFDLHFARFLVQKGLV